MDTLAKIWVGIDSFSYPKIYNIDHHDVDLLNKARYKLIVYPSVTFALCFIVSKSRERIFNLAKRTFLNKNKRFKEELENYRINKVREKIPQRNDVNQTIETIQYSDLKQSPEIEVFEPRKVLKKNEPYKAPIIHDNKPETFSEEYGGFLKSYKRSSKSGLVGLKYLFKRRLDNQEELNSRINRFLFKTKLIYLPFFVILLATVKEFLMTYFGLYCKYQPLVDRFFQNIETQNKTKL